MTTLLSERVKNVPASGIRMIFEKADQIPDAIRLEVGEPDFDTPRSINDAAKEALDDGRLHPLHSCGGYPAAARGDREEAEERERGGG